jgi:hypothetical protein
MEIGVRRTPQNHATATDQVHGSRPGAFAKETHDRGPLTSLAAQYECELTISQAHRPHKLTNAVGRDQIDVLNTKQATPIARGTCPTLSADRHRNRSDAVRKAADRD